jgi:ABC-type lipopolysaccharide export system ATPase subunit
MRKLVHLALASPKTAFHIREISCKPLDVKDGILYTQKNFRIIRNINEMGIMVLLVEQNVLQTLAITHYGYVLSQGRMMARGATGELTANSEVQAAYFG